MESFILSFPLFHLDWVSTRIDDMEKDIELDKCMLHADLLDRIWGSWVLGEEVTKGWLGLVPIDD